MAVALIGDVLGVPRIGADDVRLAAMVFVEWISVVSLSSVLGCIENCGGARAQHPPPAGPAGQVHGVPGMQVADEHGGSESRRAVTRHAMHAIHNARVQLAATAFNNLGVGAIVAAVVAPTGAGHIIAWWQVAAWPYFAAGLFTAGHFMLRWLR